MMPRRRNNTWREEEMTSVEVDLTCELKCPVCLELLTWPIILPCSHVLCKDPCADRLFRNGFVRCPVCRDDSYVSGGINSLPRVITLEHIIEMVSLRSRTISSGDEDNSDVIELAGPEDVACQLCSGGGDQLPPQWVGPSVKAVKMCLHCNVSYCKSCLKLSHPDRPPFSQHNMVDPRKPDDQSEQEDSHCQLHELAMDGFCLQCKTFACRECWGQPDDPHIDHEVIRFSEAVDIFTIKLKDQMNGLEFCQSSMDAEIVQHQACLASFQRLLAEKRSQIHSECDSLVNEIENKRQFFLSDLQYDERNKMAAITSVLEDRRTRSRELEDDIMQAKNILVETEPRNFIKSAAAYLGRNTRCFQHAPNELTPTVLMSLVTSSGHKVLDFRKEKAVLKDISYLTVPGTPKIDVSKCFRSTSSVVLVLSTQNWVDVVTDGYLVFYSTDNATKPEGWDQIDFKSPGEPRKFSRGSTNEAAICLMHDNLCSATVYYFGVCAYNSSGRSDMSQIAQCSTLRESQTTLKVPSIVEDRCRTFTFSTQLRSSVPLEESPDMSIHHYLLYREAGDTNKIWKSISLFGRCDHRVFGLESDTWYQFVIMSCDKNSECQVSGAVTLKTERSAY